MLKKFSVATLVSLIILSNVLLSNANIPFYHQKLDAKQDVMVLSRNSLCSANCNIGEQLSFKIVENIKLDNEIVIPKGSVALGQIDKIKKAKRMSRHGLIFYTINQIKLPSGKTIELGNQTISGQIVPIEYKDMTELATERAPISTASYATTFAIDAATDMSSFALFPIGLGVGAVTGLITGYFDPDKGLTKVQTAKRRAYYATPIGAGHYMISKGSKAEIQTGQSVMLSIKDSTLKEIIKADSLMAD